MGAAKTEHQFFSKGRIDVGVLKSQFALVEK
jgi:hypothetical protein